MSNLLNPDVRLSGDIFAGGPPEPATIRDLYRDDPYVAYQAPRFCMLLELLPKYIEPKSRLLDVGRTMLTEMIAARFGRPVDSIGFEPEGEINGSHHYHFDLNDAQYPDRWLKGLPGYDLIVMAEVIEHLYTSPSLVLGFLKSLLNPGGHLIVQTPNGVSIGRRLKMLSGSNPFELIREDNTNPGHFREYTERELRDYGRKLGMKTAQCIHTHCIDMRYIYALKSQTGRGRPAVTRKTLMHRIHETGLTNFLYRFLPPSLKSGLTIIYRNPTGESRG